MASPRKEVPMAEKIVRAERLQHRFLSLKEDGIPWWVTVRNWHAGFVNPFRIDNRVSWRLRLSSHFQFLQPP